MEQKSVLAKVLFLQVYAQVCTSLTRLRSFIGSLDLWIKRLPLNREVIDLVINRIAWLYDAISVVNKQ